MSRGAGLPRKCASLILNMALAGLASFPVAAEDEDLYFTSLPIVATVSRLPQALADAPGSVTVLDREMIRASGARNVSDLLRLVPGFLVTPTNTDAPRVAYHGLGTDSYSPRVQVLLDGRSQYSPLFSGGVNWNVLPVALEDIARIEVVRGSNSAAYGSNAFLGVVNIITLDASQAQGGVVEVKYGNQGVRDQFVRWGGRTGPVDFRLSLRQQADQGYFFKRKETKDPPDISDDFRQRQVDFRADAALTDRDHLQIGLGSLKNRPDIGRSDNAFDPPRQFEEGNAYAHVEWRRFLEAGEEIGLRYFHSEETIRDSLHAVFPLPFPLPKLDFSLNLDGNARRDDLEFQHILKPAQSMRLVWGTGVRRDSVSYPIFYYGRGRIDRFVSRLFGNLEWRLSPVWLANFGGNWEHDSFSGTTFAPRLNVSYQPAVGQTLRLGFSRAYRTPTAYERHGDVRLIPDPPFSNLVVERVYLASPGLRPERVDGVDIGYLGNFPHYRASLDVRLFQERVSDRIMTVPRAMIPADFNGEVDYGVNGQRVTLRGIEYQGRWQPWDSTRLLLNQAYVHITQGMGTFVTSGAGEVAKIERQTLESAPSRMTTAMLMQKLPFGIEFSATQHWVGEMRWTANSPVPAYRRLDLRLAYPFRAGGTAGEVAFVSQSANGDHAELKETRIIKERHWLTLRLDL